MLTAKVTLTSKKGNWVIQVDGKDYKMFTPELRSELDSFKEQTSPVGSQAIWKRPNQLLLCPNKPLELFRHPGEMDKETDVSTTGN